MSDPTRIPRILKLVEQIWLECPELRLGQLLTGAVGRPSKGFDIFYETDEKLEAELRRILRQRVTGGHRLDE